MSWASFASRARFWFKIQNRSFGMEESFLASLYVYFTFFVRNLFDTLKKEGNSLSYFESCYEAVQRQKSFQSFFLGFACEEWNFDVVSLFPSFFSSAPSSPPGNVLFVFLDTCHLLIASITNYLSSRFYWSIAFRFIAPCSMSRSTDFRSKSGLPIHLVFIWSTFLQKLIIFEGFYIKVETGSTGRVKLSRFILIRCLARKYQRYGYYWHYRFNIIFNSAVDIV